MPEGLPPIVHLNKGEDHQPRHGPRAQPFPHPPSFIVPPDLRPQGFPPNRMPQTMNHQNQMDMSPQHFPHPPMHIVPHDLRPQPSPTKTIVEISDIRGELLTEAEAWERLSTYVTVRLEKIDGLYDVDELGFPLKSTWERVKRYKVADISQQEARRQVRALEKETKPVGAKKADCRLPVQRQLERAQEALEQEETDRRFCYTLVQFETKTRRKDQAALETHGKSGKKDQNGKHGKKSNKYSASKKSKKPPKEMIAITAYFKRSPTPDQNSIRLLHDIAREREMKMVPFQMPAPAQQAPIQKPAAAFNQSQPANPPQQVTQQKPPQAVHPKVDLPKQPQGTQQVKIDPAKKPQSVQPQNDLPKQPQGAAPKAPPQQGQQKAEPKKQPHIVIQKTEVKESKSGQDKHEKDDKHEKAKNKPSQALNIQIVKPSKSGKHVPDSPRRSRSSHSSSSDEGSSSSLSDSDTLPSSVSSGSGAPKHRRGRSRGRSRTPAYRPADFGISHRIHHRPEGGYIVEDVPPRYLNRSPGAMHPSRGSPIRESPYPGVRDRYIPYNSRTAPAPQIFQAQGGIRHLSRPMARHEILEDDLRKTENLIHRMRLDAAFRGEDLLAENEGLNRLSDALHRRKALQDELLDIPWRERDAVEYMDAKGRERSAEQGLPLRERRRY